MRRTIKAPVAAKAKRGPKSEARIKAYATYLANGSRGFPPKAYDDEYFEARMRLYIGGYYYSGEGKTSEARIKAYATWLVNGSRGFPPKMHDGEISEAMRRVDTGYYSR